MLMIQQIAADFYTHWQTCATKSLLHLVSCVMKQPKRTRTTARWLTFLCLHMNPMTMKVPLYLLKISRQYHWRLSWWSPHLCLTWHALDWCRQSQESNLQYSWTVRPLLLWFAFGHQWLTDAYTPEVMRRDNQWTKRWGKSQKYLHFNTD